MTHIVCACARRAICVVSWQGRQGRAVNKSKSNGVLVRVSLNSDSPLKLSDCSTRMPDRRLRCPAHSSRDSARVSWRRVCARSIGAHTA